MVHLLYSALRELLLKINNRICKPGSNQVFLFNSDSLLPLREVHCSEDVKNELKCLSEKVQLQFLLQSQKHYLSACSHLLNKTEFGRNSLLECLTCLGPKERKSSSSDSSICTIAKAMPIEVKLDTLLDEWKLLRLQEEEKIDGHIDHYWNQFFEQKNSLNEPKYYNVTNLVKACLSLSHGSAPVERGFSKSGGILTPDKTSMSVRTLNAKLYVVNGLKSFHNRPDLVPINKEFLSLGRNYHKNYRNYLKSERLNKEKRQKLDLEKAGKEAAEKKVREINLKTKSKVEELSKDLKAKKEVEKSKKLAADKLFDEATVRLQKALKRKDFKEVEIAQGMLEGVKVMQTSENETAKQANAIQYNINRKTSTLITSFFPTK